MPITPVSYSPRPYVRNGTMGELLRLRGRNAADAELRQGEIQAQMWSNLGNTIAGTVQNIQKERQEAPRRALEDKARAFTVADAEAQFAARKKGAEDASILSSAQSMDMDPDAIEGQLKQLGRGDLATVFRKSWTESETAAATLRAKREEASLAEADYFGSLAAGVRPYLKEQDGGLGAVRIALQKAKRDGFEEADDWLQRVEQNPAQIPQMVDALMQASPTQRKLVGEETDRELRRTTEARALADMTADNARAADTAAETARHNREQERIASLTAGRAEAAAAENARHNRAMESLGSQRLAGGEYSDDLPSEYRTAMDRAILNMPATRRRSVVALANRLGAEGNTAGLGDVIRQAAIEGENVDTKNQVLGRGATMASLRDTRAILNEMKDAGVPTGWLTGNVEDLARRLGTSTNTKYVELSNRLMGTLINYRRAATGVSFGAKESGDYERMFPNYRNVLPVNIALIDGLEREMQTYDAEYWTHKLGPDGAKLVGVGQARAVGTGGGTPTAPAGWKYVPKPGGGWTAVEDK